MGCTALQISSINIVLLQCKHDNIGGGMRQDDKISSTVVPEVQLAPAESYHVEI